MNSATDRQLRGMTLLLLLIAAVMLCLICTRGCRADNHAMLTPQAPAIADSVFVTEIAADTTTATKKKPRSKKPAKQRQPKTYPERSPLDEHIY
ncbi:MAG: hypothetical protein K2M68_03535 [Muribaculaceae bacterium]|nr:hypothetical protein [Muribaculaceae bacterium]